LVPPSLALIRLCFAAYQRSVFRSAWRSSCVTTSSVFLVTRQ
jgi:hypothetical protein